MIDVYKKTLLLCGVTGVKVSQNLIPSHMTIVSTNENTGNYQIVWEGTRLA